MKRPRPWLFNSQTGKAARARVGRPGTMSGTLDDLVANEAADLVRLARRLLKIALDPKTKPREAIEASRLRVAVLGRARALRNPGSKDAAVTPPGDAIAARLWRAAGAAAGPPDESDSPEDRCAEALAESNDAQGPAGDAVPEEAAAAAPPPDPPVTRAEDGRYYHPTCTPKELPFDLRHGHLSEAPFEPADERPTICAGCGRPFDRRAPIIRRLQRSGPWYWHRGCAPESLRSPAYEVEAATVPPGTRCRECLGALHEAADAAGAPPSDVADPAQELADEGLTE